MNNKNSSEEMQVCSKAVYDLLISFNALPSIEEQEEVLDVIYDAMYHRSYENVLAEQVVLVAHKELEAIELENAMLYSRNKFLKDKIQKVLEQEGKKHLKKTRRDLLIIINNIRHFLGDSWDHVIPGGMESVDRYLDEVDVENILGRNIWEQGAGQR